MESDLECRVCYRLFNGGLRCPRELSCRHSFCERCLLALCRPAASSSPAAASSSPAAASSCPAAAASSSPVRCIVCPLCRRSTSVSRQENIRTELRVDEDTFERMLAAGVLSEEDPEEEEEAQRGCEEDAALVESQAEESDSPPATRSGRFRRAVKRVWKIANGSSSRQPDCVTSEDMRCFAMMSYCMF